MSAQGVVDAVKDGVQQVTEKLQGINVEDSANTGEAKPTETKPQTLLDEVTGEYVSKSELKKRQKQRRTLRRPRRMPPSRPRPRPRRRTPPTTRPS
jgi:lysyl-tRNA synthetase class 2